MPEPSQSPEQSEQWRHPLGITVSTLSLASSSPGGNSFQLPWVPTYWCAVTCMVFTSQCAGTCRLLPFLVIMAPVRLFLLQIHGRPVALVYLAWPPLSHWSRMVSQVARGWPQDLGPGDHLWCPLRRTSRKPTAPQGYRDSVPPLPALSPSSVNEGNWFIFPSVSPKGSLLVHTLNEDLVTSFTTAAQSHEGFPSPDPLASTRSPMGDYFGYPTVAQPGCSLSASQWAAIYLRIGADLSHDSYLPYSLAA